MRFCGECLWYENFDVRSLDLFADFLYREVLELVDLDWAGKDYDATCRRFHIMPRFSRTLPGTSGGDAGI